MLENIRRHYTAHRINGMIPARGIYDVGVKISKGAHRNRNMHTNAPGTIIPFKQVFHYVVINVHRFNPGFQSETACQAHIQIGTGRNLHRRAGTVENKSLSHFPGCKTDRSLQHTVVGAYDVIGITFARPPTDQAGRHWRTGSG